MKYNLYLPTDRRAEKESCSSGESSQPEVVAMAYVPMQQWGQIYEPEQAWNNGTLFPELNKPFCGKQHGKAIR